MKKILLLILLFAGLITKAQFPNTVTGGNSSTLNKQLGAYGANLGFVWTAAYSDTTAANLSFIKNVPGIVIRIGNDLWMRSANVLVWIKISGSGSGGYFNPDQTSTGNTLHDGSGYDFVHDSASNIFYHLKRNGTSQFDIFASRGFSAFIGDISGSYYGYYDLWKDFNEFYLGINGGETMINQSPSSSGSSTLIWSKLSGQGSFLNVRDTDMYLDARNGKLKFGNLTNLSTQNRLIGQYGTSTQVGYTTMGFGESLASGILKVDSTSIGVTSWVRTKKVVDSLGAIISGGGLGTLDTLLNPKWNVVQDAGGTTYKSHAPSVFYAADFGVKADGATDDWTKLDSCLRYAYDHGGGDVVLPLGKIMTSRVIRFPLDDVDAGSANLRSIRLIGQALPNMYSNPLAATNHPQYGTIIEATFLGDSAIIDTRYTGVGWGNFNLLNIGGENISLRIRSKTAGVDVAAQGQGINAQHMAFFNFKNISISTTSEIYNSVQPASTSAGILFPANNNGAIVNADNIFVTGVYYAGMGFEHTNVDNWFSDACYYGFFMNSGNHSIHINKITVARCKINIGTGNDSRFKIDNLSIEDKISGGEWWENTLDLEAGATSTGVIHYQRVETVLGGVNNDVFRRTDNAYNITCLPLGENIPKWATDNRPDIIPEAATIIGYNTDSSWVEVYDHLTSSWNPVGRPAETPNYCDQDFGVNLNAYWDFEESSGDFIDKSGNGKDLTRFGSAATITGKLGNGEGNIAASSQYVKTAVGTGLSAGAGFTFAGWVKMFNTADTYQVIAQKGIGGSFNFEYNLFQAAGTCYFSLSPDGTAASIVSVNKPFLRDSLWHFISATWDGATMSLQIDNGTAATASIASVFSGSGVLYLGSDATPSLYLTGGIDEVGIWNTALSAGEVTSLYNSGAGRTIGSTGGGILFAGDDCQPDHDINLHWDNTNKSLGVGTNVPSTKSVLDLTSTTKGFLPPRMTTTQRNAIASPVVGLLIWNTTDSTLQQYRGLSGWASFGVGSTPTLQQVTDVGNTTTNTIITPAVGSADSKYLLAIVSSTASLYMANAGDFATLIKPQAASTGNTLYWPTGTTDTLAKLSDLRTVKSKGVFLAFPTSADTIDVWQTPVAITITSLKAILRGTSPSVTYNIAFGTNIQSPTAVFTADITCTSITTGCSNSSGFNDATIPAGSFIWIYTTAASGTIRSIAFTINYTED